MSKKDPYEILGVARTATPEEIKRAYRRLAKEHHPDRNPTNRAAAEKKFKEIQAAYEVLGDSDRRKQYDRFGEGGPPPDIHSWATGRGEPVDMDAGLGDFGDLSSIFEQFFSRGGARAGRRNHTRRPTPRGEDLEYAVDLTFDEALRGATREVILSGAGNNGHAERIQFQVPPGVTDGQRIRVRGKGQEGAGGRGDLMILCRVRPHPYFRREGRDVLIDLPLGLTEAALGAQVEIPTPEGKTLLTVPPGASSGVKLRLRGRGVHDPRTGETGDLYAVIRIQAPRELSARARELLEQLGRELDQRPRQGLGWPT